MARQWRIPVVLSGGLSLILILGYAAHAVARRLYLWQHGEPTYNDILSLRDAPSLAFLAQLSELCGYALLMVLPAFVLCTVCAVVSCQRK